MRRFVILSVAIAVLFAVAVEGQPLRQVCQPNSVFKVECNTCWCSTDGTDMGCTRKACQPNNEGSTEPLRNKKKMKRICEPGSHFKNDCNDCRCSDDGMSAACTLKGCPH